MGVPGDVTPAELRDRLAAERAGLAFLLLRDGDGRQRIVSLVPGGETLTIGRHEAADVALPWDKLVSRVHARLERVGGHWVVVDDGLSRNGTQVNGQRVQGRRRLVDGDHVRVGGTVVQFREPEAESDATEVASDEPAAPHVSEAQRRVLVALCRPYRDGAAFATPATNQRIAEELVLSLDAVKGHLRALFAKFGVDDLPPNEKRVRLVERVLAAGVVTEQDL